MLRINEGITICFSLKKAGIKKLARISVIRQSSSAGLFLSNTTTSDIVRPLKRSKWTSFKVTLPSVKSDKLEMIFSLAKAGRKVEVR